MPDKRRERYYFDLLRSALPELSAGRVSEPEPPDFLVEGERVSTGLELTVFHLPPEAGKRPHQEQQSLAEQIVARAERIHADLGGPALYVGIHFDLNSTLSKRDIQPLAAAVAQSVLRAPYPSSVNEPVEQRWGQQPARIWGIQIHPSIDGTDKLWHAGAGGWVADITSRHVADVIAAKSPSGHIARRICDRVWLVIVQDAFSRAAPAEITKEALSCEYTSEYDRVIWFVPHAGIADLRIRRAAA